MFTKNNKSGTNKSGTIAKVVSKFCFTIRYNGLVGDSQNLETNPEK